LRYLTNPYLINVWKNGFSCTKSRPSLSSIYEKLYQEIIHHLARFNAYNYDKIIIGA
jgi:hypothetical protein